MVAVCLCTAGAIAQTADSLKMINLQEVVVKGVRAQQNAPFAVANFKKSELQSFGKTGRELPFLFANTPGVVAWSENGTGIGTSHIRIRGAADSRINVTLDGVALNSPEDQCVFWANMNSYAALMGSAQIQRGIGTSTNGDGAFGGTISLATAAPSLKPQLEVNGGFGTYNSYNVGFNFSSGLLWDHVVFNGAYHESSTDGFLHGTAGRQGSYLGAVTYYGDKFSLSYKNVGNFEKTGQAWSGITGGNDDATLVADGMFTYKDLYKKGLGRYNSLYEGLVFDDDNYTFPKDANGNYQTYRYKLNNGKYWDKTTDNFYQNHNILSAVFQPSAHWSHNVALHYTYGYGYYAEFRPNNKFKKFGLTYYDNEGNFVKRSDFIRKKGLTQHTYGLVYNANYKDDSWDVLGGVNLQQFRGGHFGYLTYIANEGANAQFRGNGDYQYYDSDARKNDYSAFVKATLHLNAAWDIFGDVQYRHVGYKTDGKNDKFYEQADGTYKNQMLNIDEQYNFVNPKAGITFQLVDCLNTTYSMNGSNTNVNGWRGSTMRTSTMATLLNQLSSDLKSVLKFVNKVTSKGNNQSGLETTSDKLFLLSEIEVFGATQYSYAGEGKQYEYYTAGNSTIKKVNGSAYNWWERSPRSGSTADFCFVGSYGSASYYAAGYSYGVSFGFCV